LAETQINSPENAYNPAVKTSGQFYKMILTIPKKEPDDLPKRGGRFTQKGRTFYLKEADDFSR